jgi:hypothetical protein
MMAVPITTAITTSTPVLEESFIASDLSFSHRKESNRVLLSLSTNLSCFRAQPDG